MLSIARPTLPVAPTTATLKPIELSKSRRTAPARTLLGEKPCRFNARPRPLSMTFPAAIHRPRASGRTADTPAIAACGPAHVLFRREPRRLDDARPVLLLGGQEGRELFRRTGPRFATQLGQRLPDVIRGERAIHRFGKLAPDVRRRAGRRYDRRHRRGDEIRKAA